MKTIHAQTNEELSVKSLGLYHDHCYHLYRGKIEDMPKEYKHLTDKITGYILVYKED